MIYTCCLVLTFRNLFVQPMVNLAEPLLAFELNVKVGRNARDTKQTLVQKTDAFEDGLVISPYTTQIEVRCF